MTVRSVERALTILGCFEIEHPLLGISEIAERSSLSKATVHRILTTLKTWGYIQQDESSSKYQLGLRLFELGTIVGNSLALRQIALPVLEQLGEETQETALLVVYDDGEVVYLEVLECPQPVKIDARTGKRLPAYCTASGKAFLSMLPLEEVERVLSRPLTKRTPRTIVEPAALLKELATARERGYAISNEEYNPGIRAVAVPIVSSKGSLWGVVSVAGPAFRLSDEVLRQIAESTMDAAQRISDLTEGRSDQTGLRSVI